MKVAPQKSGRKGKNQSQLPISKEVKKAISRFIRSTEKIVQSVSPQAVIVVPKPVNREKKTQEEQLAAPVDSSQWAPQTQICTPQFRGTALGR